jgi:hypothetical protein
MNCTVNTKVSHAPSGIRLIPPSYLQNTTEATTSSTQQHMPLLYVSINSHNQPICKYHNIHEIFSDIHSVDSLPVNISGKYYTPLTIHTIVLWYGARRMNLYLFNTFHSIFRNLFYNSFNVLHFTLRNITSIITTQQLCCNMWTIYKFIYLEKLQLYTQDLFLNNFNILYLLL